MYKRQLYGGANLFKFDAPIALGQRALEILETYAPNHEIFGSVFGLNNEKNFSKRIYEKVIAKLKSEAIEDFRIDFEDCLLYTSRCV